MAYTSPSTHPHALVSTLLPTDKPAEATAEHLEREHWTDSADLSGKKLPNTNVVYVTSSSGSLSAYLHKTGSFAAGSGVLIDDDGRSFVLAQTLTASAPNVAVGNAMQLAIALHDAELAKRWIDAGTLSAAISLHDAALTEDSSLQADLMSVSLNLLDATLSTDWLGAEPLSLAVTLHDAVLFGGWIEASTLATGVTPQDADLFLAGPLSAQFLSVSVTLHDATMFLGGMNPTALSAAITLHPATLELLGPFVLTSGDAQSGTDVISLSGDQGPGSLKISGS